MSAPPSESRRSDVMDTNTTANNVTYNNVEKLQGLANYVNWKFAIRMLLTLDGVLNCVEGTDTDAEEITDPKIQYVITGKFESRSH